MLNLLNALNKLSGVDIAFFVVCVVIILVAVGIYFLIPVFNKKQYQEQRENLKKREAAFKTNRPGATVASADSETEVAAEAASETDGE